MLLVHLLLISFVLALNPKDRLMNQTLDAAYFAAAALYAGCITYPDYNHVYSTVTHLSAMFTVPTNLFGVFCIIYKSPSPMKTFKWFLLQHQLWSAFFDLSMNTMIIPILLLPVVAGYGLGLFSNFGLPTEAQCFVGFTAFGGVLASVIHLFFYRHQVILSSDHCMLLGKKMRLIVLLLTYLYFLSIAMPILFIVSSDPHITKLKIAQAWPCFTKDLFYEHTLVVDLDNFKVVLYHMMMMCIVATVLLLFLVFHSFAYLNLRLSHLSAQTRGRHRNFIKALVMQITFPLAFIVLPAVFMIYRSITLMYNQVWTNMAFIVISLHGSSGTVSMLFSNAPYRSFIYKSTAKWSAAESQPVSRIHSIRTTNDRSAS